MSEFVTLVSNVGFPIACVCYMALRQDKQMDKFTETIDRNTRVIERLTVKLDQDSILEEK